MFLLSVTLPTLSSTSIFWLLSWNNYSSNQLMDWQKTNQKTNIPWFLLLIWEKCGFLFKSHCRWYMNSFGPSVRKNKTFQKKKKTLRIYSQFSDILYTKLWINKHKIMSRLMTEEDNLFSRPKTFIYLWLSLTGFWSHEIC